MRVAVVSQNRRKITGHTGRCRKFWIYEIETEAISGKQLLELQKEQSFHDSSPHDSSSFEEMLVFIARGMGTGLVSLLKNLGVKPLLTMENIPDKAVGDYLQGALVIRSEEPREYGHKQAL